MQAFNDTADVTHFIHGERVRGSGVRTQAIFNPATGERPRKLLLGEIADVNAAVASARAAFPKWSNTPSIRRARVEGREWFVQQQDRRPMDKRSRDRGPLQHPAGKAPQPALAPFRQSHPLNRRRRHLAGFL